MGSLRAEGAEAAICARRAGIGGVGSDVPGFAVPLEDDSGRGQGGLLDFVDPLWVHHSWAEFDASRDALVSSVSLGMVWYGWRVWRHGRLGSSNE